MVGKRKGRLHGSKSKDLLSVTADLSSGSPLCQGLPCSPRLKILPPSPTQVRSVAQQECSPADRACFILIPRPFHGGLSSHPSSLGTHHYFRDKNKVRLEGGEESLEMQAGLTAPHQD